MVAADGRYLDIITATSSHRLRSSSCPSQCSHNSRYLDISPSALACDMPPWVWMLSFLVTTLLKDWDTSLDLSSQHNCTGGVTHYKVWSLLQLTAHPFELPVGELPLAHHVVAGAARRVPVYLVYHVAHSPARHLSRYCVDIV